MTQAVVVAAARTPIGRAVIAPVTLPDGSTVSTDDGPRPGTTFEATG